MAIAKIEILGAVLELPNFSIAMFADYSFDVKKIDIWVPAFFKYNNSFIATVVSNSLAYYLLNKHLLTNYITENWVLNKNENLILPARTIVDKMILHNGRYRGNK